MANCVNISVIGAAWLMDRPADHDRALAGMIEHLRGRIEQVLPDSPDLIVLPEMCDQYRLKAEETLPDDYYEARGDRVLDALAAIARQRRCYIAYPALRRLADGSYRNSVQMIDRAGQIAGLYDKNFPTFDEIEMGVEPGEEAALIACDFGRVACAICFDLNFDELRLHYAALDPDLIVFPSAYHGGMMQAYWAYSCRAHFAGACAQLPSAILSPAGTVIATSTNYQDFVSARVNLDCELCHLDLNYQKLRAARQKYGAEVSIRDPGLLGSVLLSSESDRRTVGEVIDEFGLLPLDRYFADYRQHRRQHLERRAAPQNV